MVTDLMMPGMDGQELLKAARTIRPDVEVVLMTAYGTVETAVAAMKDGAYDFITKPLKRHALVKAVQKALEKQALVAENKSLKAKLAEIGASGGKAMVGQSPAFRAMMDTLRQAAPSTATVLLIGETGTGKELVARALHEHSPRAKGPFVAVNCAALPESILEAELFGDERGAFTGAVARREGRFERAHGGTLFLDEVGEMPLSAQVKLLRVLQEGEIERLGGTQTVKVDVRLVAATNKDLQKEVAEGRFREDLYYRLNVVEVRVPALASRREDIPAAGRRLPAPLRRQERQAAARLLRGGPAASSRTTPGPATCASWSTPSSAPSSWPAARCSRPAICPRVCARARWARPASSSSPLARPWRRSSAASSTRPCATPRATRRWPPGCWASPRAPSTASWSARPPAPPPSASPKALSTRPSPPLRPTDRPSHPPPPGFDKMSQPCRKPPPACSGCGPYPE